MVLYPPLFMEATTGDTAITYTGKDFRGLISALAPVEGTILAGDLAVSQRGAGANMSVDVAAGRAVIQGDAIAGQGTYIVRSDATTNVLITAADATNPRIDIIVARIHDKQADGGTTYSWTIDAIAGTPAASPTAPATPSSSLLLAQVAVAANATSVTTANITNKRVLSGVGDVPKWDLGGGGGQSIPDSTDTIYAPTTDFQPTGVTIDNPNSAQVTIVTPGRYDLHFSVRLTNSTGPGERTAWIRLYDPNGALVREIAGSCVSQFAPASCASGTLFMSSGQTVKAGIYQNTGSTLTIWENWLTADFTGIWVGP